MIHNISYLDKSVAILAATSSSGEIGGAERFYNGLHKAIQSKVGSAELMCLPTDESTFEQILNNYDQWKKLDLLSFDMVISTKAPTYVVRHPCHVLYLMHTIRVFYDMFDSVFPNPNYAHFKQRQIVQRLDTEAFRHIRHRFSIGHTVSQRLRQWNKVDAEVLHPPLCIDNFLEGEPGDYFFVPGRLHDWKRVDLAIKAVKESRLPIKLVISGKGEAEEKLRSLAKDDPRIEFLGHIGDDELVKKYANALGVVFVPIMEDYGLVTLEAFKCAKPVITCKDSGEPLHFVIDGKNGFVCNPEPKCLSFAMEKLFKNRSMARLYGEEGKRRIAHINWDNVADRILTAGFGSKTYNIPKNQQQKTKVAILDMQPIDPPIGGGRLRLMGLYHGLGDSIQAKYIGTYDWPGEKFRQHLLSPTLEEIDIPLSSAHHSAAAKLAVEAGGKIVIDLAFPKLCHLSPDYIAKAKSAVEWADIVIFSHPWVYPLMKAYLKKAQLVVYDSQNVEGLLRAQLLDEQNPVEANLLREVVEYEYTLGERADLILSCCWNDLMLFNKIYDFPIEKINIIPNGVMAFAVRTSDLDKKNEIRKKLKISNDQLIAIFIGSAYPPNVEAARFIIEELSELIPDMIFVIAGGVGNKMIRAPKNIIITGYLDENKKNDWLCASDIAINPMFSGSGTNIKMFDFMVAKLPIVTTEVGARGIETGAYNALLVVEPDADSFVSAINRLRHQKLREKMGNDARSCVEEGYAWEHISRFTGKLLKSRHHYLGQLRPLFSVVIPTFERHSQLDILMKCIEDQIEIDFEVVVIDQSEKHWKGANKTYSFSLIYCHSPVRGAVRARNTGVDLARGKIIAFTDDDCQPYKDWLINARKYFKNHNNVGVEGIIESDHLHDSKWRPVTNVDFEGIGFMTANLMVRTDVFRQLGGFDLKFDKPHFREDSDLGWRLQEVGRVPYARDVKVFHPAQLCSQERESSEHRARFFEKDALLYKKHPERYKLLFFKERHYEKTAGFWENILRGFKKYDVKIPKWILERIPPL